jgi:hypothetical protein
VPRNLLVNVVFPDLPYVYDEEGSPLGDVYRGYGIVVAGVLVFISGNAGRRVGIVRLPFDNSVILTSYSC